jgi:hypothetical protein
MVPGHRALAPETRARTRPPVLNRVFFVAGILFSSGVVVFIYVVNFAVVVFFALPAYSDAQMRKTKSRTSSAMFH